MTTCEYSALREAACHLSRLGLSLQTVIPVALPAESYPLTRQSSQTGQREIQCDKNGRPLPAFVGKNPSFWLANGEPRLTSQSQPADESEVVKRLEAAERLGRPIGLAIIPSTDVVVIDFDRKNYPSQEALDRDWMRLLDLCPELTQTRIERTPGGGVHIYVKPADGMDSWRTVAGKLHCNFTTELGGPHRGEVLAGTRVSVCAPTSNGQGSYELINHEAAYCFAEVPDLASIGIFPEVKAAPEVAAQAPVTTSTRRQPLGGEKPIPRLVDLIGGKAQNLLAGGRPYGSGEAAAADRSLQLTGFVKELYSWHNLLLECGLSFEGDPDQLLEQAITCLDVSDKSCRVLATIDPSACRHADPDRAQRHYDWLAGGRTHQSTGRSKSPRSKNEASVETAADPTKPSPLSREECRDRLREAVGAQKSPTELELVLGELVDG